MLQLIDVSEPIPARVELDDYLPLIVRWGDSNENLMALPNLYWGIGNRYSLLEIGIEPELNVIRVVKVVNAGQFIIYDSQVQIDSKIPAQLGLPICNTADWSLSPNFTNRFFREDGTFELHIGKNHVCVVFSPDQVISQLVSGRVRFGLDQNNYLCMLEVGEFSDQEMARLIDTLKHQQSSAGLKM
jgi:hypothetical protein